MDLAKMIADLQEERDRLDEAIEALERLSAGQPRRRGRPPKAAAHSSTSAISVDGHYKELEPPKVRRASERS